MPRLSDAWRVMRSECFEGYRLERCANSAVHVPNRVFFSCISWNVILCFSHFSYILMIVQVYFFGNFLYTLNEESDCAKFGLYLWSPLYNLLFVFHFPKSDGFLIWSRLEKNNGIPYMNSKTFERIILNSISGVTI